MGKTFSLESFKEAVSTNVELKNSLSNAESDIFDEQNGVAVINRNNINKYLEKYLCKDEEDLENYLYYHKGIFLKVI